MNIRIPDHRVLVTGASGGIGSAVTRLVSQAGGKVAINYLSDQESAEDLLTQVEADGGSGITVQADISQPEQVKAMFQKIDQEWQGVDIVINNAGIQGERVLTWEAEISDWRQIIDINLLGTFLCCRQALQRMVPQESGVILNISSVHERIPWSGFSAYTASKAALAMLTQTLSLEAAPHGVRIMALAPGAIKTPINREVWQDDQKRAELLQKIPLDRVGEPEEIARTALFLVSPAAGYLTGSTVFADGGMIDYPDFAEGG